VEARLAADPQMRQQLDQLRALNAGFASTMSQLDGAEPLADPGAAMQRRVSRAMRQWQVDRLRESPDTRMARSRRPRMWVFVASAAALAIFSYVAWWGFQPASNDTVVLPLEQQDMFRTFPPGPVNFPEPRFDPLQDFNALAAAEAELDDLADLRTSMQ
jgi:hypothetical protein